MDRQRATAVIKNSLAVYHWFVRQALNGNRVVARKPTGEEVTLNAAELAVLEARANRMPPAEFGLLISVGLLGQVLQTK